MAMSCSDNTTNPATAQMVYTRFKWFDGLGQRSGLGRKRGGRARMGRVRVHECSTAASVGEAVALRIAKGIARASAESRAYVLGCPSGRTGLPVYNSLARIATTRNLDLSHVIIAMMDEYVEVAAGRHALVSPTLAHSCLGFGRRHILDVINSRLEVSRRIAPKSLWVPPW